MDFTKIKCLNCPDVTMKGAGGQLGGRVSLIKVKCPNCDLCLMIIPMSKEYKYTVTASTEDERKQELIQKAKDKKELELAKEITRIEKSHV